MSPEASAPVNRILKSSIVDGPGNRAAVFLQGCNFCCAYCHNPETVNICNNCGACVEGCPAGALSLDGAGPGKPLPQVLWDSAACTLCDACIKTCPCMSSPRVTWMSADMVMEELEPALDFARGLTVSGGECTLYPEFLRELGARVRGAGKTFFLDTNGCYDFAGDPELMELVDGVMLDVKAPEGKLSEIMEAGEVCGTKSSVGDEWCNNEDTVRSQLQFLANSGKLWEVRTVVSPGLTDAPSAVEQVCRILKECAAGDMPRYKLIRYRPWGVRPKAAVRLAAPEDSDMQILADICLSYGVPQIII